MNIRLKILAEKSGLNEGEKHDLYQIFMLSNSRRKAYILENFDKIIDIFAYYHMQTQIDQEVLLEKSLERIQLKVLKIETEKIRTQTKIELKELKNLCEAR